MVIAKKVLDNALAEGIHLLAGTLETGLPRTEVDKEFAMLKMHGWYIYDEPTLSNRDVLYKLPHMLLDPNGVPICLLCASIIDKRPSRCQLLIQRYDPDKKEWGAPKICATVKQAQRRVTYFYDERQEYNHEPDE